MTDTRRSIHQDLDRLQGAMFEQRRELEHVLHEQRGIQEGASQGMAAARSRMEDLKKKLREYVAEDDPRPLDDRYYALRDELLDLTHQHSLLENAHQTAKESEAEGRAGYVPKWAGD